MIESKKDYVTEIIKIRIIKQLDELEFTELNISKKELTKNQFLFLYRIILFCMPLKDGLFQQAYR